MPIRSSPHFDDDEPLSALREEMADGKSSLARSDHDDIEARARSLGRARLVRGLVRALCDIHLSTPFAP